jgi:hypothetical protein
MPLDEPRGLNPPDGAFIDYSLPSSGAPALVLEIQDAGNNIIRRYSSADAPPFPNPAKLRTAPEWFQTPSTLSTTPGMHRFVWPIRLRAPAGLDEAHRGAFADGVWAPPGMYTVALTVGSQRLTQPLVIAPDPRINLPADAYANQFAFAKEVTDLWGSIHAALKEAEDLLDKPAVPPAIASRVREISEVAPAEMWWLAPRSTTSLRYLDVALAKLVNAIDDADAAPTPDARAGWVQIRPVAESTLQAWTDFKSKNADLFKP